MGDTLGKKLGAIEGENLGFTEGGDVPLRVGSILGALLGLLSELL